MGSPLHRRLRRMVRWPAAFTRCAPALLAMLALSVLSLLLTAPAVYALAVVAAATVLRPSLHGSQRAASQLSVPASPHWQGVRDVLARRADVHPPRLRLATSSGSDQAGALPLACAVDDLGWGSVIMLDTQLLTAFDLEQVQAVLAHEIAHLRAGDSAALLVLRTLQRLTVSVAAGTLSLAALSALALPTTLPGGGHIWLTVTHPVSSAALSTAAAGAAFLLARHAGRRLEFAADAYAVALTGQRTAMISVLSRLHTRRHWQRPELLDTHPRTARRLRALTDLPDLPTRHTA